ncbi:helix-turn-helix domain-containing protein [Listeria aquatica]|uniref:helix-turn-helix domain-containing protein n=1 Tax=Listeria aquatica TaxID=1494960 RepID=UPI003F6F56B1
MNFIELLSKKDQRMLVILNELTIYGTQTFEELLAKIAVSRKTLLTTINEINLFSMKKYNQAAISVQKESLFSIGNLNTCLFDLYKETARQSIPAQILVYLFTQQVSSTFALAEKCFSSSVTIHQNIKQLNVFLEQYDLQISASPIRIAGEEHQIRFMYKAFFWALYQGNEWPFILVPKDELIEEIENTAPYLASHHTNMIQETILYDIAVILSRRTTKNFITKQITHSPTCPTNKILYNSGRLVELGSPKEFVKLENSFTLAILEGPSIVNRDYSLTHEMFFHYQNNPTDAYQMLLTLMECLQTFLTNEDYRTIDTTTIKMQFLQTFSMVNYFKGLKEDFIPFRDKQEKNNLFLDQIVQKVIHKLVTSYPNLVVSKEVLRRQLSRILIDNLDFTKYLPVITILIDFDMNPLHNHLIKQIKKLDYHCLFLSYLDTPTNCDLLISSSVPSNLSSSKVFTLFHRNLTHNDYQLLDCLLSELTREKLAQ